MPRPWAGIAVLDELVEEALKSGRRVRFRATGGSMRPAIREGDILVVAPARPDELAPGDIVLSRVGRKLTAHRLVAIERPRSPGGEPLPCRFLLREDASAVDDLPLPAERVIGRVVEVERAPRFLGCRMLRLRGTGEERIARWISTLCRRIAAPSGNPP